jgi:hypothetical protein
VPSNTNAGGDSAAGKVILLIVSSLSALLVLLGLFYFTGASSRHQAAVAVSGCEVSLYISSLPCITQPMVVSEYDAIMTPADKLLGADMAAYDANQAHDLVAAEAALTSEAATEQTLDGDLATIMFTPQNTARTLAQLTSSASNSDPVPLSAVTLTPKMTVIANALVQADQSRATVLAEQARSTSLAQLRSFDRRVAAAGSVVQTELALLRTAVDASPQEG